MCGTRPASSYLMAVLLGIALSVFASVQAASFDAGQKCFDKKDYECAVDHWYSLASAGNAEAQFAIGRMYWRGIGVEKDYAAALAWYEQAADASYEPALLALGEAYTAGEGILPLPKKTYYWYKQAAQRGSAEGMRRFGQLFEQGYAAPVDLKQALSWYEKAAKAGNEAAQLDLGHRYRQGKTVDKNLEQAKVWFQQAAEQGSAEGQYYYGLLFLLGKTVAQDDKQASKWIGQAAQNGFLDAQYRYALMIKEGRTGVPLPAKEAAAQAVLWLAKAANNQHQAAAKKLEEFLPALRLVNSKQDSMDILSAPELGASLVMRLRQGNSVYLVHEQGDWVQVYFKQKPSFGVFTLDQGHRIGFVLRSELAL